MKDSGRWSRVYVLVLSLAAGMIVAGCYFIYRALVLFGLW